MQKSGNDQKISMVCVLACTIYNSREQSAKQKSYKILHVVVDQTLAIHCQGADLTNVLDLTQSRMNPEKLWSHFFIKLNYAV